MALEVTPGSGETLKSRLVEGHHVVAHDVESTVAPTPPAAVVTGKVSVVTAGTSVPVSGSSVPLTRGAWVRATGNNLGLIYLGESSVSAANGYDMSARDTVFVEVNNLNLLYIDASLAAQSISYIAF